MSVNTDASAVSSFHTVLLQHLDRTVHVNVRRTPTCSIKFPSLFHHYKGSWLQKPNYCNINVTQSYKTCVQGNYQQHMCMGKVIVQQQLVSLWDGPTETHLQSHEGTVSLLIPPLKPPPGRREGNRLTDAHHRESQFWPVSRADLWMPELSHESKKAKCTGLTTGLPTSIPGMVDFQTCNHAQPICCRRRPPAKRGRG